MRSLLLAGLAVISTSVWGMVPNNPNENSENNMRNISQISGNSEENKRNVKPTEKKDSLLTIVKREIDLEILATKDILEYLLDWKHRRPYSSEALDKRVEGRRLELINEFEKTDKSDLLFFAAKHGFFNLAQQLIEDGEDVNKENDDGMTPLFYACNTGNLGVVKYLVEEHGVNVDKEDKKGETPLFDACRGGNFEIVKYLVEHGADVNKENMSGKTPLFYACKGGNLEIVKYLVEHGADVNKEDG